MELLGMAALGGMVMLLRVAQGYASKVQDQTLDARETCIINVDQVRARVEYELLRMGLVPGAEIWRSPNCVACEATLDPQLGGWQPQEVPFTRMVAMVHNPTASSGMREKANQRLLNLLQRCRQVAPPGILLPFTIDVFDSTILVIYPASWDGTTLQTLREHRRSEKQIWWFLRQLGQGLSFLEGAGWTTLGIAEDIPVDRAGNPVLVVGAQKMSGSPVRVRQRTEKTRPRSPYVHLWVEAGRILLEGQEQKAVMAPMLKVVETDKTDWSFAQLFGEVDKKLEEVLSGE